jgi:hypothetical protein
MTRCSKTTRTVLATVNPRGAGVGGAANPGRLGDTGRAFAFAGIVYCEARGL